MKKNIIKSLLVTTGLISVLAVTSPVLAKAKLTDSSNDATASIKLEFNTENSNGSNTTIYATTADDYFVNSQCVNESSVTNAINDLDVAQKQGSSAGPVTINLTNINNCDPGQTLVKIPIVESGDQRLVGYILVENPAGTGNANGKAIVNYSNNSENGEALSPNFELSSNSDGTTIYVNSK